MDGGLDRVGEIRRELLLQWQIEEEAPGLFGHWRRALSLPLVGIFIAIAIVVRLGTRRGRSARSEPTWLHPIFDRVRRVLLTGVPEAEAGNSGRAALSLLLVVALAALPFVTRIGFGMPWLHAGAPELLPVVAGVGLLLYLGVRYLQHGRGSG